MSFTFRKAVRENVNVLIGIAGGTGSGKTLSALRLARGLAGDGKIALIDTESGRGLHYADLDVQGIEPVRFDHGDLTAPFTPSRYQQAVEAADAAGYSVIVIDSASHEHAGDGGLLDMHDAELKRMGGKDSAKFAAWIKPKGEHKRMLSKLLQCRAHLVFCFRAEEKIEIVKEGGKTKVRPKQSPVGYKGWLPVCEKNLPFEMTASFLVMADRPGVPHPIKLQEQHKPFFPLDRPLTEESGRMLAVWAAGGSAHPKAKRKPEPDVSLTEEQIANLQALASEVDADFDKVLTYAGMKGYDKAQAALLDRRQA